MTLCFPHASFPLSLFGGVSSGQSLKPGLPEPARVVCSLFFLLRPCMSFYDRELLTEVCGASLCGRVSPHWYKPRQSCMMLSHLKKSNKKSCFAATALPDLYGVFTPNQLKKKKNTVLSTLHSSNPRILKWPVWPPATIQTYQIRKLRQRYSPSRGGGPRHLLPHSCDILPFPAAQ